ncbi:hypothetical protein [Agaribacterium haliotis]|uniref:phosphotriesterase family protein n=1 Tax=Agaribacterium haliotis TaxID=2013869 RepID=UPI001958DFC9|nr:hypothetical protein [Agaribacterium haliotis]
MIRASSTLRRLKLASLSPQAKTQRRQRSFLAASLFWLLSPIVGAPLLAQTNIQTISERVISQPGQIWLSHEHLLVDFRGPKGLSSNEAELANKPYKSLQPVVASLLPFLLPLSDYKVSFFVDATPKYLGRNAALLQEIQRKTGLNVLTNTGLYGVQNNRFIPKDLHNKSAQALAELWIDEFKNGIDGSSVKPGFIKIGVDAPLPNKNLNTLQQKLVEAAALCHQQTGLSIVSHTGPASALWPQLEILKKTKVEAKAFIWAHAYMEKNNNEYIKAAKQGVWISLDGLAWDLNGHIEKLLFAKQAGILNRVLIAHDAGWYDPQKAKLKHPQSIKPYTSLFTKLIPALKNAGFSPREIQLLVSDNPAKAFALKTLD